jgi:Rrf2 family protein
MLVTQKKQYALRAVFELAKRKGKGPVKTLEIAEEQAIPLRFLEVILSQLKRKGLVVSKRGIHGGYTLNMPPDEITVGHIFRLLDDSDGSVECISCVNKQNCPFLGDCVFMGLWSSAHDAVNNVYNSTTVQHLIDTERVRLFAPN